MRLIDADVLIDEANSDGAYGYVDAKQISEAPTIAAVPVSELKKLRDYLYAEDLIFMRGLAELNKLIANCGAKMDEEVSELSEKQEKRRRYNQRLEYIADFNKWLDAEPSILRPIAWHKWKKSRPILKEDI